MNILKSWFRYTKSINTMYFPWSESNWWFDSFLYGPMSTCWSWPRLRSDLFFLPCCFESCRWFTSNIAAFHCLFRCLSLFHLLIKMIEYTESWYLTPSSNTICVSNTSLHSLIHLTPTLRCLCLLISWIHSHPFLLHSHNSFQIILWSIYTIIHRRSTSFKDSH